MIGKGTRWKAKKQRGGLFAYTILDITAEDILRSRPSPTGIRILGPHPVAEIPYPVGSPKERAEIADLIERAPLMREVLLQEAENLKRLGWVVMAGRLEEAAGGRP